MRFLAAVFVVVLFPSLVLAQTTDPSADLFQAPAKKSSVGSSSLRSPIGGKPAPAKPVQQVDKFAPKLSAAEQEKMDSCKQSAAKRGADIDQILYTSGFMSVKYDDQTCTSFVVTKLLTGIQVAIRDNPEALAEYQRNPQIRTKFDELKKAYALLTRGNPVIDPNAYKAPEANKVESPVFTEDSAPEQKQTYTSPTGSYLPADRWAHDYSDLRYQSLLARVNVQQQMNQRNQAPQGSNLLQDAINKSIQDAQQNEDAGRQRMQSYRALDRKR
jgi:hypothetical protein